MTTVIAALMELRPEHRNRTSTDADFGRAARLLARDGIAVVVADPAAVELHAGGARVSGFACEGGGWRERGSADLAAVYNRLPARHGPRYCALVEQLEARGIPVGNPLATNTLALDKLAAGVLLHDAGLPVPETQGDPARFDECLRRWGAAFHKPRYGSFGAGVSRLVRGQGSRATATIDGQPAILQRAVAPPAHGPAGVCVRGFLQRQPDGAWVSAGRVARVSPRDPVANVARGARGIPLPWLEHDLLVAAGFGDQLDELEPRVAAALEDHAGPCADRLLEIGLDWVLDTSGDPWLIEINGKPGGRLRVLATIPGPEGPPHMAAHHQALVRPFRYLAGLANQTVRGS